MSPVMNLIVTICLLVISFVTLRYTRHLFVYLIPLSFLGYFFKLNLGGLIPLSLPEIFVIFLFLYALIFEKWIFVKGFIGLYKYRWPLFLIIIGALVGVFSAWTTQGDLTLALGAFKGWVIFPLLTLFLLVGFSFTFKQVWNSFNIIMSIFAICLILCGLFGYGIEGYYFRLLGPYSNANYIAFLFVPLLCGNILRLLSVGLKKKDGWYKSDLSESWNKKSFGILLSVILGLIVVIWSQSYGGILALIGSVIISSFVFFPRKRSWVALFSVLALLILVVAFSGSPKFQKLTEFDTPSSISSRIQIWTTAWHLSKENPILGIGLRQFESSYNTNANLVLRKDPYETMVPHPHNQYLDWLLSYGILGLIGFVWLFVMLIKKTYKFSSPVLFAVLIALLIHGIFDTWYSKIDIVFLFWFYVSIILILRHPGNILPNTNIKSFFIRESVTIIEK